MNVKKLLKKNSSAILPSESVKNRIKNDCGVVAETAVQSGASVAAKRKVGISVAAVGTAIVGVVTAILICVNPVAPSPLPDVINFGSISSATDFYACSAVSVGNMLDGENGGFASSSASVYSAMPVAKITDGQKSVLGKYATFATGFLGNGKITSTYTLAEKSDYEYKLGIGYSDGFGVSEDKILYFNKLAESDNTDDDEEEFAIVGELVTGGVSYPVEGTYESETDGEESENEVEFIAYTSADKSSYIAVEYESEVNSSTGESESKFVITVFQNGKLAERAKVNGESGDEEYEVDVINADGEKIKLKFNPDEKDGKKLMGVHASFGDDEHKLIMRPQNDNYDWFDFIDYEDWDEEDWDFDDWDFDFGDWGKNDGGWYDHGDRHGGKNEERTKRIGNSTILTTGTNKKKYPCGSYFSAGIKYF